MIRFSAVLLRSDIVKAALAASLLAVTTLHAPDAKAQAAEDAPLRVGKTFIAAATDPAQGSAGWALVSHGIADQLFRVDRDGRLVGNLATDATRIDDLTWQVTLAPDRLFSDGSPVTAQAVADSLNRTVAENPAARASAGALTFEAQSESLLTITSERPTPVMPSILAEWAFPVYLYAGGDLHFTGPFMIADFTPGARLDLKPNPHYPQADSRNPVQITRVADGQALALALRAGEIDLAFHLPVESRAMLQASGDIAVTSFPVEYQYMMWMNTASDALGDARVRRAIDLAIDREALIAAARAGRVAHGAFSQVFPFSADEPARHDAQAAAALLDEAGWIRDGDGPRMRDGETLSLTLVAYPQRPDLVTYQPVIRAALADLGIEVTTRITESPTDMARAGEFDLFLWAQHTAPAGDPGFFLLLFLGSEGANNYSGWSSAAFDALLADLAQTSDPQARNLIAREAQALIAEEAPVAFLVTPEWHVGKSARLAEYEPWGSDYYVIRSDFGLRE
ncbi:ABC transporter substrate-binding protein [Saliniramus sp.]|uniref:ABC transporter substrate-binding protein n=1 Tax=Saliniramus sp. TaxID=2986772 RepID=UPI002C6ACC05|nr:ABC transporter substrate-binding protein [Saliniramus sp.]HMB12090.1 ABC transporter substrate-binding protein [Saliniramus sp.]